MTTTSIPEHALACFEERLRPFLELAEREPALTEVMYRGGVTAVDIAGEIRRVDSDLTDAAVLSLANNCAVYGDAVISRENPDVSVVVPPDWRVTFARPPSVRRPVMFLRKLRRHAVPLEDYVERGAMTAAQMDELVRLVEQQARILIAGGTSSGKTTLLRALLARVPPEQHIVTIEDAAELLLVEDGQETRRWNWTDLVVSRSRDMAALLRLSLRMRPDRIVVGEVRGPEAIELVRACTTGHQGGMFTIHADPGEDALDRLHQAVLQGGAMPARTVRRSIDAVVHIAGRGRARRVGEIWHAENLR